MALSWKSVGHFFASALKTLAAAQKIAPVVEAVTAAVPGVGVSGVALENAGFAVLGELVALLNAGGEAAKQKLADAGLDIAVIQQAEGVLGSVGQLAALVKAK